MRRFDRSIQRLAFVIAVLALVLQVHATFGQQAPARAPVIVTENEVEEGPARVPRRPGAERAAQVRRAVMLQNPMAMGRGATIPIVVEGDYVYVMYGTHLCQFSVDGLKLMAKVDLRDLVGPDRATRRAERLNREGRPRRDGGVVEPLRPRDGDEPATPAEAADTPAPEAGTDRDAPAEPE